MMGNKFKGVFYALISSGTFGLIPLFSIPLMLEDNMEYASILFYRFLFSAILMGAICYFKKDNFRVSKASFLKMFFLSLLYAVTALCLVYSYKFIPSGIATTIHFLYPICVSLLMVTFFKEKKSLALFLSAILSLIGVALMCWRADSSISIWGVAVVSVTIISYALYIVGINKSSLGNISAEMLTFYILFFGAVLFSAFALLTTGVEPIPSKTAGIRLFLLAFLPTIISDLTLILAIKYAGSTVTSILGSMEPLVAVLVGIFCFSEYFDLYSFAGITLILISVGMVILAPKNLASERINSH